MPLMKGSAPIKAVFFLKPFKLPLEMFWFKIFRPSILLVLIPFIIMPLALSLLTTIPSPE